MFRSVLTVVLFLLATLGLVVPPANANTITLSGVPAYTWWGGCVPTSLGMIFGYWDTHGYPNLFDAQGLDVYNQVKVRDQITSPAHFADPNNPVEPYCIADFTNTSMGSLGYGITSPSMEPLGAISWADNQGYSFDSSIIAYASSWGSLVTNINAGRPILFDVDSDGDGKTGSDHTVAVIGYNDVTHQYLCYNTDNITSTWYDFQTVAVGHVYGVADAVTVIPLSAPTPVPEPSTFSLLLCGAIFLLCATQRK